MSGKSRWVRRLEDARLYVEELELLINLVELFIESGVAKREGLGSLSSRLLRKLRRLAKLLGA